MISPTTFVLLVGCTSGRFRDPQQSALRVQQEETTCSVSTALQKGLAFPDGRIAFVHAQAIAGSDNQIAITGSPLYALKPGPLTSAEEVGKDSLLGFIIHDGTIVAAIPSPIHPRPVRTVRVATGDSLDWHLLFVEPVGDTSGVAIVNSANIWYGRFDGERWHDVSVVAQASAAKLGADLSSALLRRGNELLFAYAFDQSPRPKGGIVMLRGRSGTWWADTLRSSFAPNYVSAALADSLVHLGVVQAWFDANGHIHGSSVFHVAFDTSWHSPRLIADGTPSTVRGPQILVGEDLILTWQTAGSRPRAEWAALKLPDTQSISVARSELLPRAFDFAAVGRAGGKPVWLVPNTAAPDSIAVLVRRNTAVRTIGTVELPNTGLSFKALAVGSTIVVASSRVTLSTTSTPAQSYVTILNLTCPD